MSSSVSRLPAMRSVSETITEGILTGWSLWSQAVVGWCPLGSLVTCRLLPHFAMLTQPARSMWVSQLTLLGSAVTAPDT